MAGVFDQFPQWRKYWGMIQRSARTFGMNPNETLATHIFENGAADPGVKGPVAKGRQAVGLAQIWDTTIGSGTNPGGWAVLSRKWKLRDGQNINHLKTNPEFAIDYLAWRMAGSINRFRDTPKLSRLDQWYRSGGYNPGFSGDSRGPGPSIYVAKNAQTTVRNLPKGVLFPVAGGGTFTSFWGDARDGGARLHEGVDIAADHGTPLIAVADGTVRLERGGAGGNQVFINNKFYYAHLSKFAVANGEKVKRGQVIGYVGNTGTSSSGPHLHFSIFNNGKATNPLKFLQAGLNGGVHEAGEVGNNPPQDPYTETFFPEAPGFTETPDSGLPFPGGQGLGLPGGFGQLPATQPGLEFQRRDLQPTWQLIAQQPDAGPTVTQFASEELPPL